MNPGELRHRITLQKLTNSQDSFGQQIEDNWMDIITVWASIEPLVGKQYFAAEQVQSEISHKIKIRYLPGITPDMRIKYSTRIFQIVSPLNYKELNIELQLMCKELL